MIKKLYILYALLLLVKVNFGQDSLNRYLSPEFKIVGVSTNLMNLITKDLLIDTRKKEIEKRLNSIGVDIEKDKVVAESVIKTFDAAYNSTLKEMNQYDYFSTWPEKVSTYGVDFLKENGFTQLPQSISQYLPAALQANSQRLCQFYLRDIENAQDSVKQQIEKFAEERFAILKAEGILGLEAINDYYRFAEQFTQELNSIPNVLTQGNTYLKKEIIVYAYQIRSKYTLIIAVATNELERQTKEWNNNINNYESQVRKLIEEEIRKDAESFKTVKIAQQKLDEGVDKLVSISQGYKTKLADLETKIKTGVTNGFLQQVELHKAEYKKVTEKLNFVVGIAQSLNSGKIDIAQAFDKMKDDAIKKLFGSEINNLKAPFSNPGGTIVSELNNVSTFVQVAYNFTSSLSSLGILKGDAAQRVQAFVSKAMAAVQIGTGVARIFAGDVSGIFSVVGGFGGLFGSGGQSPEQAIMDMMQKNFAVVNERLDSISIKIDRLSEQIYNLHKDMANSFQIIFNDLDEMKFTLANVHELARLQLFYEYNTCVIFQNKIYDNIKSWSYTQYYKNRPTEVGICLEGLNKLSITPDVQYFLLNVSASINQLKTTTYQSLNIYKPAYEFFRQSFSTKEWRNVAATSLQLPVKYLGDLNIPISLSATKLQLNRDYFSDDSNDPQYNSLEQLFNPAIIFEYTKLFDKLSPYFEICWQDDRFRAEKLEDYLKWDTSQYIVKNQFQRYRINKLLDITNKALMQQCLISGQTIMGNIIQSFKTGGDLTYVQQMLSKNKLLAQNFSNKILFEGMGLIKDNDKNMENALYKLYVDLEDKVESKNETDIQNDIRQLNTHITPQINCNFYYDVAKKNVFIRIPYTNSNIAEKEIFLDLPPAELLLKGEMLYPSAVYDLIEARKILEDNLASEIFNEKLYKELKTDSEKQLFKLLYKLDYNKKY